MLKTRVCRHCNRTVYQAQKGSKTIDWVIFTKTVVHLNGRTGRTWNPLGDLYQLHDEACIK